MKVLRLKETYVVFIESLQKSVSFNEFVDNNEKSYFCRTSTIHYKDITENYCLGHFLEEAIKTLDNIIH